MTETLADLLCSDAWWQRVGPDLSSEGRALVKETLTTAAAKLDDKEKDKFTEALRALRAPSEQQRAWLRDVATMQTLPESEKILDFSAILICHPDTGAPIDWKNLQLPDVTFKGAVFVGKADFWKTTFRDEAHFEGATFTGEVNFLYATFERGSNFLYTTFTGEANFWQTTFKGEAYFLNTTFTGEADFQQTEFLGITIFRRAHFQQVANFHAARFGKTVSFRESKWNAVPDFIGTAWKDGVAIADFKQLQTNLITIIKKIDWRTPSTSDLEPKQK